jgi:hypothetical protein
MAPPKTKFKKHPHPVHIELELVSFAREKSLENGCVHNTVGSASEFIRRGFKSWLLQNYPYLKNITKNVDWNEKY